ncbi:hypothetical protein JX266_012057 [Neoarthrinium moseri]|uniref:uncharacterized protein n=1 Tax=Neoarthrinium moseri TaxID=1658444 RepID=UPI001FDB64DC|nr:uncharacterized protein JN550_013879 [Neoarthrinium moseri]KAI1841790.1 hypothetical protein JX266_012057 [Neoarthrinium moseri]KAI1856294.1 hypothetical protein JN550_013879 [Neoarthrinium moseri]
MATAGGGTGATTLGHAGPGASAAPLQPTWRGLVSTTMDALHLFEGCLLGRLNHVPRRPHDRERSELIVSGNVFIYEEHSSGIKRWTDGVPWSPSRILGNFLIYRELDKPFQPGEKKRAMKKAKENGVSKATAPPRSNSIGHAGMLAGGGASLTTTTMVPPSTSSSPFENNGSPNASDFERQYVGSLVDSYQFKPDGLIKKTISVTAQGVTHHLVSYYSLEDVKANRLLTPSQTDLKFYTPRSELIQSSNFRAPVDDHEIFFVSDDGRQFINGDGTMGQPLMGPGGRSYSVPHANLSSGWGSTNPYIPTPPSYQLPQAHQSLSSAHGLPSSVYATAPAPSFTWDAATPQTHRSLNHSQSFTLPDARRSQSVAYAQSPSHGIPFHTPSSLQRSQLNGSGIVPSNGGLSQSLSNGSFSSPHNLFGSQGTSTGSSQHLGYDSSSAARNSTSYSNGSQDHDSSSFSGLPHAGSSGSTGVVQPTSYGAALGETDGNAEFHSASDGQTPDGMLPPSSSGTTWPAGGSFTYQH